MTARSDLPRLGASLGLLGTLVERDGQTAYDRMAGWEFGPRKAPQSGETGGGGGEAAAEDRKDEAAQRRRAAIHFREFRADLAELDRLVQRTLRRIDIACPPLEEEYKNRRTGELDPWSEAEIVAAGWCRTCWLADQTWTVIPLDRKGFKRYRDACSFCGAFRAAHGIDPPKELLVKHNQGRNLSEAEVNEAVKRAKKSKKGKRGKKGKVAA